MARTKVNEIDKDNPYGCTKQQKMAAEFYVYNDFKLFEAVTEAYPNMAYNKNPTPPNKGDVVKQCNRLKKNLSWNKYVNALVEQKDHQTALDKHWVIDKLKHLASNSKAESSRLRALELLGKHLDIFTEKHVVETKENPAAIAQEAIKRRRENKENLVEFKKEGTND